MKKRFKCAVSLCLAAVLMLCSCGGAHPDATGSGAGESDGIQPPDLKYETVAADGAVYAVYDDHAELLSCDAGGDCEIFFIRDMIGGVPVSAIRDGAFDGCGFLRIAAKDGTAAELSARKYAEEHALIFIEVDSVEYPDHYYPDSVGRLSWHPRDTSEDGHFAVDDNDVITKCVDRYLSGRGYWNLRLLILRRYVCASEQSVWNLRRQELSAYVYDNGTAGPDTDYDRYSLYYSIYNEKSDTYTIHRAEQLAVGDIDTSDEYEEYIRLLYTDEVADEILRGESSPGCISAGGYIFYIPGGIGYSGQKSTPTYFIEIEKDTVTLHERRDRGIGNGGVESYEYTFKKNDGKWQLTERVAYYPSAAECYDALVGDDA